MVTVGILALFLTLRKGFQLFTVECEISCGPVISGLYYVEICSLYNSFCWVFLFCETRLAKKLMIKARNWQREDKLKNIQSLPPILIRPSILPLISVFKICLKWSKNSSICEAIWVQKSLLFLWHLYLSGLQWATQQFSSKWFTFIMFLQSMHLIFFRTTMTFVVILLFIC